MTAPDRLVQQIDAFLYKSPFPWWEWDMAANKVTCSPRKAEMLGYDYADFKDKGYQAFTDLLHPEDYEPTMNHMRDVLAGKAPLYQVDYRIKAADDSFHWYMDRGRIIKRAPDNSPLRLRGLVLDLGKNVKQTGDDDQLISLFRQAVPRKQGRDQFLHICSGCLKLRSGNNWLEISESLDNFISMEKSHTVCPDCLRKLYPRVADRVLAEMLKITEND